MPYAQMDKAFKLAGHDLAALKKAAIRRDFKPAPINLKASVAIENTTRSMASRNVIGVLEGSDPKVKDEYIVYMGHWDHLGRDTSLEGDQIYNGAMDNATGIAGIIELARRLGIPSVLAVLNKVALAREMDYITGNLPDIPVAGVIPFSNSVREASLGEQSIDKAAKELEPAIRKIIEKINS